MMNKMLKGVLKAGILTCSAVALAGTGFAQTLEQVMKDRGLAQKDIIAAAKTYNPSGKLDEYIVFSSGGQAGQVIVYGVPSMRIIKYIGVFTPEPWQGWGFDKHSQEILEAGSKNGKEITWGDTHHPMLSENNGDYDGEYLFINDKANPRIAVIDLKTFETSQIVSNPVFKSEHGAAITPNSEYIMEAAQYPAPMENMKYQSLDDFNDKFRGGVTYWKFNRGPKSKKNETNKGKIDVKNSFTVEMPPYMQDIIDAGKGESFGWSFNNSINTERHVGGYGAGNTKYNNKLPYETGSSAKDTDYMHVVNWQAAEKLFKAGKFKKVNGHPVIPIEEMVKANALFLIPEAKSPHGNDVSPDGRYIIVSGKLDTHTFVYDFRKIKELIDKKDFAGKDPYGIPILDMQKALHKQVNVGLGPLHTQYDKEQGIVYTSLYVDSKVVRWNYLTGERISDVPINYNIGHLVAAEGETVQPDGKYLVALNKLAIDRFNPVGPLHPQNHQLIDITAGREMQVIYDMPLPLGEPHYAVMIKADKMKPLIRYQKSEYKHNVRPGSEKVEVKGKNVTIHSTAVRSHFSPEIIEVKKGSKITWHITNVERAQDQVHGFTVDNYNVHGSIEPGETATFEFVADKAGVYPFYCTEFCSALHLEMTGYLLVK